MKNKGVEKAAMLMMLLNEELASKIISMFEEEEVREISFAMSNLGTIPPETVEKLVNEFSTEITENLAIVGNIENTERFLNKIFGKDKVDSILEDIRGPAGRNIWDKLANVGEELLANYLKKEYPQTTALVLSKLSPMQSSKVLSLFSPEFAFEVIKRMLVMDPVKKEVLERVEKTLKSEFISSLNKTQKMDNNQIIAEVFNNLERGTEAKFMSMLEQYNMEVAEKIRSLMFTFEDLKKIDPVGMQTVIKVIDKTKLALALKGASETIRDLFVKNMSQRAAKILLEEIEGMGPVKLKDVNEAQSAIINTVKELISKGEIEIMSGDNSDQLVY